MDKLLWTWEKFAEPSLLGFVGSWQAKGATGTEYTIPEHPESERRWGLVWSERPGQVTVTGRGPDLDYFKAKADENERQESINRESLGRRPAEARRARRRSYTAGRVYR